MNNHRGVLDDVSGIPWDAALFLATYLYGTDQGRDLCIDACSCDVDNAHHHCSDGGGILELGSGLGMVSLAAIAVVAMRRSGDVVCNGSSRIVITDRNDTDVLTHLKKNVDANIKNTVQYRGSNARHRISVEACDWIQLSKHLQLHKTDNQGEEGTTAATLEFPRGPFNLILGSALIYLPDHAAACADTIHYYLSDNDAGDNNHLCNTASKRRRAIIVQLPDRSGFSTHFLPRCQELGLNVVCETIEEELIRRVERSLERAIASACDYRMYIISKNNI